MPKQKGFSGGRVEVVKQADSVRNEYFLEGISPIQAFRCILKEKNGNIETHGCSVKCETLDVKPDKSFIIYLPQNTSPQRDVFVIARALGHLYLHTDLEANPGQGCTFNRRGSDRPEREASWFAAELLMPENEFKRVAREKRNMADLMAIHFGVSRSAALVRMSYLGIL